MVGRSTRASDTGGARAGVQDLTTDDDLKVQARTFHEVHRVAPDGELIFDIVAEFTQRRLDVPIDPKDPNQGTFVFRGGTTVIFNRDGEVRYAIQKNIGEPSHDKTNLRLSRQREYLSTLVGNFAFAPYASDSQEQMLKQAELNFSMVHRGF